MQTDTTNGSEAVEKTAARLIVLCAEQLRAAGTDASQDINAIVTGFLSAVRDIEALRESQAGHDAIESRLRDSFMQAIVQLQFGDRLSQRVANICNNLVAAAAFLDGDPPLQGDAELNELLATVRSSFSMEREREQFDAAFPCTPNGSSHG